MDQIKVGKFLSALRRERGMTQEQLGELLGVSNKTVSRWENGHYVPDIDMLVQLSNLYGVSINELICGTSLTDAQFRTAADENLVRACRENPFPLPVRLAYWKHKWRRDHLALVILLALGWAALFILAAVSGREMLAACCPLVALALYAWLYNRMMAYAESHAFDPPEG